MKTDNASYVEATDLQAKLYWELNDGVGMLHSYALASKDKELMVEYHKEKRRVFDLLSSIGYRATATGLFVQQEADILDREHSAAVFDATITDIQHLMRTIGYGKPK